MLLTVVRGLRSTLGRLEKGLKIVGCHAGAPLRTLTFRPTLFTGVAGCH